ncbi:TPA: hypothetical protein ACH3X1_003926 [Trebouxia sp. C0004]
MFDSPMPLLDSATVWALSGSRSNTSVLKKWLMQHLAALQSYRSQVSAAEIASHQKRHAAASAAAVTANMQKDEQKEQSAARVCIDIACICHN